MRERALLLVLATVAWGHEVKSIKRYAGDIIIDGRSGKVTGEVNRTQCGSATVAIKNKQPFVYKYAFNSKSTPLTEPGLAGLNQMFGGVLALLEEKGQAGGSAPSDPTKRVAASCPNREAIEAVAKQFFTEVDSFRNDLRTLIPLHQSERQKAEVLWATLQDAGASESALEKAARELVAETVRLQMRESLRAQLILKLGGARGIASGLLAISNGGDCGIGYASERTAAQIFLDAVKQYEATLETVEKDNKLVAEMIKFTAKVLLEEDRYEEMVPGKLGPFRDPNKVDWTLTLTSITSGDKQEFKGSFGFGSARFHAAAGLAFAPMNLVEYARVDGVNAAGAKDVRVGRSNSSNFRAQPMAMVHGRVNPCKSEFIPLYISGGITAKGDNKGTVPEYLIGLSTSFVDERIFLTGGAYIGKQQILQGGLREGDVIPSTLAELPISKGYRSGFGFAITYRFK